VKKELRRIQKDHSQTPFLVTMNDIFNHRSFRYKQVNYHSIWTIWSNIHSTFLGSVRRDCTLLLFSSLFIEIAHAQCCYSSRLRMRDAVIHRDCACAMLLFIEIAHAQCCYSSRLRMRNVVIHQDCAIVFSLRLGIPRQCSSVSAYHQHSFSGHPG